MITWTEYEDAWGWQRYPRGQSVRPKPDFDVVLGCDIIAFFGRPSPRSPHFALLEVRFPKEHWSLSDASSWKFDHNISYLKLDVQGKKFPEIFCTVGTPIEPVFGGIVYVCRREGEKVQTPGQFFAEAMAPGAPREQVSCLGCET